MKRIAVFAALCALALAAGCQTTIKKTAILPDGRRLVTENTPVNERAGMQAAAFLKLAELAQGGHFGRKVEVRPIDPTKPVNAAATVTDTDPAVVQRLMTLASFTGYRDPTNGWDALKTFFNRLFGLGEKVAEKGMWAYGMGHLADKLKARSGDTQTTFYRKLQQHRRSGSHL